MLIKIKDGHYISKNAIHQIFIADDKKTVKIYGDGFQLAYKSTVDANHIKYVAGAIADKIRNNETDLSMYDWETFI